MTDSDRCSNCDEPHGPDDVFCENCGLDFLTGSLPGTVTPITSKRGAEAAVERSSGAPTAAPAAGSTDSGVAAAGIEPDPGGAAGAASVVATIRADRHYHDRTDVDDVLDYPDPEPAPRVVPLRGDRVLLGRARPSRNQYPDIDLSGDPAVSSRHALLERRGDDTWTVTDLESTNGTYVGDSTVPIPPNTRVPLSDGTPVHVGAWTRIDITHAP